MDYGRRQVVSEGDGRRAGQEVLVSVALSPTGRVEAYFADFVRITPILGLALVFVVLILVVSSAQGRGALVAGQAPVAATVNPLVLAYVGASLPLLLLFTLFEEPFFSALNRAVIAEEVVRTLVGEIGLIAAVPIATALAAAVQRHRGRFPGGLGPEMLPMERE